MWIKYDYTFFYGMTIYWNSKKNYSIPYNLIESIIDRYNKHNNTRYVIVKIDVIKDSLHANILIIDNKKKYIIRFEPYGGIKTENDLDMILSNYFLKNNYFKKYKYISPNDFLPINGFQSISKDTDSYNQVKGDIDGYCAAWCIWFVELYIMNKKNDLKKMIEKSIKKLINKNITLIEHIRNYGNYLFKMEEYFLIQHGFPYKSIFYSKYYENELINLYNIIHNEIIKL